MKFPRWLPLILWLTFLAACTPKSVNGTPGPGIPFFATAKPEPTAHAGITHTPDAEMAMTAYLAALQQGDYATMYAMLSKASQASLSQADFSKKYDDALNTMGAAKLDFQLVSQTKKAADSGQPATAQVVYQITYHSTCLGDIQRSITADLLLDQGEWRVQWQPTLIIPELTGNNVLKMDYKTPERGNIYDLNALPLVQQSDAYSIGVIPGDMGKAAGSIDVELGRLTGTNADYIFSLWKNAVSNSYVAIAEASPDEIRNSGLDLSLSGLVTTKYNSRFYLDQGIAPQVLGYTQLISPEQVNTYRRQCYGGSERIGQSGLEKSMEPYLAGKHGGTLFVVDPNGQLVKQIGSTDPQPADSIYLTVDRNLQIGVQQAISGFNGAAVVMEVNTGKILAMASSPEFDPNLFDSANTNSQFLLGDLVNNNGQPLVNRAAQGQYPLGSVFKVVTFSAALESGLYLPQTTYDCQYDFTELVPYNGPVLHDWTWTFCQLRLAQGKFCDTASTTPSGVLNFSEGLMRSCDPYYWHIGLDLFNNGRPNDIADMARAFGLGSATGIHSIAEASGKIDNPTEQLAATNGAIGQGTVLVSPLQVADFMAAVANGGTLYTPQLIQKVVAADGSTLSTFSPAARGTLPLRPDNLKLLQDALVSVVKDPRGTAYFPLLGLNFPLAGKTGTAEEKPNLPPHAWFAGYTMDAGNSGKPDIVVVVILENQGEGAIWAAPVWRRIIEDYYYGSPQATYPWESNGVGSATSTPTPLGGIPTRTPKPTKTPKP